MNKLFTKIAALSVGLAMAIGVGVAVGSNKATRANAINYVWQKMTSASEFVDGTTFLVTQDSYYLDATTGSSSCPSVGDLTLSNNLPTLTANNTYCFTVSGSGDSIKLCKATDTTKWLNTGSKNNGMRINTGSTGYYWTISSAGTNEFYLKANNDRYLSRYGSQDFRSYTNTGTDANLVLYKLVEAAETQTITASATTAYSDESVTLTTNATSATWSITSGAAYAHLSATSGKSVSLVGDAAGSVTVKAVASGFTDATKTITFETRPAGTFYDVTFNSDGGSISPAKQSIEENATFTFPSAGTKDHHSFLGWSSDGGTTKYAVGATSPAVIADIEYTAYWQEDAKYTVTYVKGEHGTGDDYVVNNVYVGSYTLVTFATAGFETDEGYKFSKWSVGGTEYSEGASITISANTTVTALYIEVLQYKLVTDPSTLKTGTQFVLVDYVSNTYRIAKDLNSGHIKMNTVTSATTVSGTTSGSTVETTEADVFTLVGSSGQWEIMRGETYLQFTGTSNGNDSFTSTSSADTKFSIVTSSTSNKLTINSNSRSNRALRYNTSTGDLRNYDNTGSQPDLYMYAIIPSTNTKTVSFNANGGTSVSSISVSSGGTFTFPSTEKEHHTLLGWSSDGGTTKYAAGVTSPAVTEDIEYTAYWQEDAKYTVTYNAGTNGTGSFADADKYGGTYTLLAFSVITGENKVNPDSGYKFLNYTVGGETKNPGETFTLIANTTVTVNFEEGVEPLDITFNFADLASANNWQNGEAYTPVTLSPITLSAAGGGNNAKYYTSDDSWRMYNGGTVNITAASGYVVTGVESNPSKEFTISNGAASLSCTATIQFKSITVTYAASGTTTYTVTYDGNGDTGGSTLVDSNSPYNSGATVTTLENTFTRDGYTFVSWNTSPDGNGTSYEEGASFTISENTTLYAIWEENGGGETVAARCYTLVTSTDDLVAGAKYIIASGSQTAMGEQRSNNRGETDISVSDSVATVSDSSVQVITLETTDTEGQWAFNVGDGYLYAASSSKNYLRTQTENDDNGKWTIAFGENGAATVTANGENTRNLLRYNLNDKIFSCYSSGQQAVYFYRLNFEESLLHNVTCDGNGNHTLPTGYTWNTDLKAVYDDLPSAEKTALATRSNAGMARYDYIIGKYNPTGKTTGTDYLNFVEGRAITPIGSSRIVLSVFGSNNTNSATIIIIVSVVGVAAIGGYFFLRRRKED